MKPTPPKLEVVDSHHHFWDIERFDYPWMPSDPGILRRNYLPTDIAPLLRANGVDRTVSVQAHQSLEETRWLLSLAHEAQFVAGVVGWVDLTSPRVGADLDELQKDAKFIGVRHIWHDERDDAWNLRPEVVRGLTELERRGLTYDFLVRPQHLKYVPQIMEQVPDLRAVIDHIAKPEILNRKTEPWLTDLRRAANISGMMCKVSGMVTEADHGGWTVEDLRPFVAHVAGMFGWDRLMYGSDWPVCLLAGSYERVVGAARTLFGHMRPHEQAAVFGGNAARFYGLEKTATGAVQMKPVAH